MKERKSTVKSSAVGETLRKVGRCLDTRIGCVLMFLTAFLIRVLLARNTGFYPDVILFHKWAVRLADVGLRDFYAPELFADYPPGYLYVLWAIGKIFPTPDLLPLKLPAILADLALAWIAGALAVRVAPGGFDYLWPVRTLVMFLVLFNPAAVALSAVWGQVDALPAAFVMASLVVLLTGSGSLRHEVCAFLLLAVAITIKPQSGFVLPPMVYWLHRRHLSGRRGRHLVVGALAIALSAALAAGLWATSGLPFGLSPGALVEFYSKSAAVYPVTSANAFNIWGAVGFWQNDSGGNHVVTVVGVPALYVGILASLAGIALVLWCRFSLGRDPRFSRACPPHVWHT